MSRKNELSRFADCTADNVLVEDPFGWEAPEPSPQSTKRPSPSKEVRARKSRKKETAHDLENPGTKPKERSSESENARKPNWLSGIWLR